MRILLVTAVILIFFYLALQNKSAPLARIGQPIPVQVSEVSAHKIPLAPSTDKDPLQEMGFSPDPEVTTNGTATAYSTEAESTFSPKEKSVLAANELLERRRSENPEEELLNLKPVDFKDDEAGMLSGRFRDDENDVEFRLSEVEPTSNVPASENIICLVAPRLKLKFKSMSPKHLIKADSTGYGVVRFSGGIYARLMWSFEQRRIVHGQIIKMDGDLPRILLQFNALESSALSGKNLKYCR